jgi:hypothetical protein
MPRKKVLQKKPTPALTLDFNQVEACAPDLRIELLHILWCP